MQNGSEHHILSVDAHSLEVPGRLSVYVEALVWARFDPAQHAFKTALAPHPGCLLNVNLGHPDASESDGHNQVKSVTLRRLNELNAQFVTRPQGCSSLLALLTPTGAMQLMRRQRTGDSFADRWTLRELIGADDEKRLVDAIQQEDTSTGQLRQLAGWLEETLVCPHSVAPERRQLARALEQIETLPSAHLEDISSQVGIGRRTMERQMKQWLGISPNQHQRIVRLQQAARLSWQREKPVDIASSLGFCDQAHLSRTVSGLTGMKARAFMGGTDSPLSSTFRHATSGRNLLPGAFRPLHADAPERTLNLGARRNPLGTVASNDETIDHRHFA